MGIFKLEKSDSGQVVNLLDFYLWCVVIGRDYPGKYEILIHQINLDAISFSFYTGTYSLKVCKRDARKIYDDLINGAINSTNIDSDNGGWLVDPIVFNKYLLNDPNVIYEETVSGITHDGFCPYLKSDLKSSNSAMVNFIIDNLVTKYGSEFKSDKSDTIDKIINTIITLANKLYNIDNLLDTLKYISIFEEILTYHHLNK